MSDKPQLYAVETYSPRSHPPQATTYVAVPAGSSLQQLQRAAELVNRAAHPGQISITSVKYLGPVAMWEERV